MAQVSDTCFLVMSTRWVDVSWLRVGGEGVNGRMLSVGSNGVEGRLKSDWDGEDVSEFLPGILGVCVSDGSGQVGGPPRVWWVRAA